jgi:2'-5' RNA ligase
VPLPPEVRDRLITLQEILARAAGEVKWTARENLHVTLVFLGDVSAEEVAAVCRCAQEVAGAIAPFTAAVQGVGCFPSPRRPRILWAGLGEGGQELGELYDALALRLEGLGFRREERRFTPHVTLGRVNKAARTLPAALNKQADFAAGSTVVEEIHINSSELTPRGARYQILGRACLLGKAS